MPVPTPALIVYESAGGAEQKIRFHTVISEDHSASTTLTKFPVQTGFEISNHAIKQNRKVVLEGVISNTILIGDPLALEEKSNNISYGINNQKIIFKALQTLVNSAIPCKVVTNLDIYEPVIFTKFHTKQKEGMVDSMQFTISGEEIQIKTTLNKSAPKLINFTKVSDAEYQARVDKLNKDLGTTIAPDQSLTVLDQNLGAITRAMYLEEGWAKLGTDFIVESKNSKGRTDKTTYIVKSYDHVTQTYKYEVNIEDGGIVQAQPTTSFNLFSIAGKEANPGSACMLEGVIDIAIDEAEDLISTSMGDLRQTAYGFKRDLVIMGGGSTGQALIGLGVDCAIAGLEAGFDISADEVAPNSAIAGAIGLPTTQDIMNGLIRLGEAAEKVPIRRFNITKILGFGGGLL